jgi:hypothetical protein
MEWGTKASNGRSQRMGDQCGHDMVPGVPEVIGTEQGDQGIEIDAA